MALTKIPAIGLISILLVSILSPIASAESAVELENPIWIAESDLGLEALASGGEKSQKIIVAGADGYARLIDGENPSEQIDLATPVEDTLRAIDWHPRGKTALIAGVPELKWKKNSLGEVLVSFLYLPTIFTTF